MVTHVQVVGDGRGGLDVSWEVAGEGPVEIAVGPEPESIDHAHPVARVDAGTRVAGAGIDAENYRAVFAAPRQAMAALLATLRDRYGTVEGYLIEKAGVTHAVIAELRRQLVQPPVTGSPSGRA